MNHAITEIKKKKHSGGTNSRVTEAEEKVSDQEDKGENKWSRVGEKKEKE